MLVKLTSFIDRRAFDSYAYVSGRDVNADPNPEAKLTAYNAKDKAAGKKGGAANAEDFALYSNLCGLLALREGYDGKAPPPDDDGDGVLMLTVCGCRGDGPQCAEQGQGAAWALLRLGCLFRRTRTADCSANRGLYQQGMWVIGSVMC